MYKFVTNFSDNFQKCILLHLCNKNSLKARSYYVYEYVGNMRSCVDGLSINSYGVE